MPDPLAEVSKRADQNPFRSWREITPMRLDPSVLFEDAAGVRHAIHILREDTCAATEASIERALRDAGARLAINTRIEIYDADSGRLVLRHPIKLKETTNV